MPPAPRVLSVLGEIGSNFFEQTPLINFLTKQDVLKFMVLQESGFNLPPIGEREGVWEKTLAEVKKITDRLGLRVDEGIRETVAILLIYGFPTIASCEGHLDHGLPFPWVDIEAPEPQGWRKAKGKEKERLKKKWEIENHQYREKMMKFLEEFYREREAPIKARLTLVNLGALGAFRLQSLGAETTTILSPEKKEQYLHLYQEEMRAFTEFLKKKFFGEKNL